MHIYPFPLIPTMLHSQDTYFPYDICLCWTLSARFVPKHGALFTGPTQSDDNVHQQNVFDYKVTRVTWAQASGCLTIIPELMVSMKADVWVRCECDSAMLSTQQWSLVSCYSNLRRVCVCSILCVCAFVCECDFIAEIACACVCVYSWNCVCSV